MAQTRGFIRFLLNDQTVELEEVSPNATLLDYIRLDARLTGTKEGCAEGDCGACTVIVGRLNGDGALVYETVNACIRFLASLDGCHVVTVERLSRSGQLHPVQEAMVQSHGSQCGFCTPGIIMSLYALWMENPEPSVEDVNRSLQGNLCRCTGYAPIIKAAQSINAPPEADPLVTERGEIQKKLASFKDGKRVVLDGRDGRVVIPSSLDDFAGTLKDMPNATVVAGATDVGLWVTKQLRPIAPVIHIGLLNELRSIRRAKDSVRVGAGVSYSDFAEVLEEYFPSVSDLWWRIGGEQVRNMGTIGGNIANGSPIGDTPPLLMALGAEIVLRCGGDRREIPLEEFFVDYGKQDIGSGEFLEMIKIPLPEPNSSLAIHKISKRRDEDISTVCGAFNLTVEDGKIASAKIAFGGMAAIPKRAHATEQRMLGKAWSEQTIAEAQSAMHEDYSPISDARASADYRMIVAKNLLMRVFHDMILGEGGK